MIALYLEAHKYYIITLTGLLLLLLNSCTRFDLDDYIFDGLPEKSEVQLQSMADTALTLFRVAEFSQKQQVDTFIFYAQWLKNYDEEAALWYAQRAYDMATEQNWNAPRGVSAYIMASIRAWQTGYGETIEDAMVDARISKRLLSGYDHSYWNLDLNILFGALLRLDDQIDSARYYYKAALEGANKLDNNEKIVNTRKASILLNLGDSYSAQDSSKAIIFYEKSDSLFQFVGDKKNQAVLWRNMGVFFREKGKFSKADSLFDLCIDYGLKSNNLEILALAYSSKGVSKSTQYRKYRSQSDFEVSMNSLKKGLYYDYDDPYFIYERMGNNFQTSWVFYVDDAHADSALYYYNLDMIEASESGAIKFMKKVSDNITYLSYILKDKHVSLLGENFEYFLDRHYTGVADTLINQAKMAYQRINKVEQRDILVSEDNKRKNLLFVSLGILLAALTIFIFSLLRQQNRRLKAEMEALRAQINPHFISNSLNAIESLVNHGNTKEASKYLVHFSRLSRQILTGSRTSITSLSNELKTLSHFLALEQLRFRDKLTFDIKVSPEINADRVEVPAMILQPYAENAIWHGIKPKSEGGHVQIEVKKEGNDLVCMVEDNGIGRDQSKALKKASVMKHKSMGMKITEDRIKAMGRVKGAHVAIQDLKDEAGKAIGTRVIIRLPYKFKRASIT